MPEAIHKTAGVFMINRDLPPPLHDACKRRCPAGSRATGKDTPVKTL